MVKIEDILLEQQNKMLGELGGGFKYGRDYNRLEAIMNHRKDNILVNEILDSIEDTGLASKVRLWMDSYILQGFRNVKNF